jgi:hypothetical protein
MVSKDDRSSKLAFVDKQGRLGQEKEIFVLRKGVIGIPVRQSIWRNQSMNHPNSEYQRREFAIETSDREHSLG